MVSGTEPDKRLLCSVMDWSRGRDARPEMPSVTKKLKRKPCRCKTPLAFFCVVPQTIAKEPPLTGNGSRQPIAIEANGLDFGEG